MSSYSFVLEKFLCLFLSFLVGGLPHQTKKRGATQEFCITMTAAQKLGISMLVLFEISGGINCLFTKAWPPIEESVWSILHPVPLFLTFLLLYFVLSTFAIHFYFHPALVSWAGCSTLSYVLINSTLQFGFNVNLYLNEGQRRGHLYFFLLTCAPSFVLWLCPMSFLHFFTCIQTIQHVLLPKL